MSFKHTHKCKCNLNLTPNLFHNLNETLVIIHIECNPLLKWLIKTGIIMETTKLIRILKLFPLWWDNSKLNRTFNLRNGIDVAFTINLAHSPWAMNFVAKKTTESNLVNGRIANENGIWSGKKLYLLKNECKKRRRKSQRRRKFNGSMLHGKRRKNWCH